MLNSRKYPPPPTNPWPTGVRVILHHHLIWIKRKHKCLQCRVWNLNSHASLVRGRSPCLMLVLSIQYRINIIYTHILYIYACKGYILLDNSRVWNLTPPSQPYAYCFCTSSFVAKSTCPVVNTDFFLPIISWPIIHRYVYHIPIILQRSPWV